MKRLLYIAAGEWRYWLRSYLVLTATALFVLLLIATSVLTGLRAELERTTRAHHQTEAEQTFIDQPDRHPHRMVHYGHYVFRAPAPMALFDPGLDPVTGTSIFLEGHRQNSAMFADAGASANLGGLSWLTPAMIYQLFGPLLVILLGHGAVVREREAGALVPLLAQGVKGRLLLAGKALALLFFIGLLLIPLVTSVMWVVSRGESVLSALSLIAVYFVYLSIWGMLTLVVSSILRKRSAILAALTVLWLVLTLVLPSVAVNVVSVGAPVAGKIETDLTMLTDVRKLGDGHNAKDPAFEQLRADLLSQYGVQRVEDLPVNFRGLVAVNAEKKLTDVLNKYADARMSGEVRQADLLSHHGWLTPTLAIAQASRAISGTDLAHYHRFLRESEQVRFDFVQGLNRAHAEKLSYKDDINRGKNEEASLKARVGSANWQMLNAFAFQPASASDRITAAASSITMLTVWFGVLFAVLVWSGGRLKP